MSGDRAAATAYRIPKREHKSKARKNKEIYRR